MPLYFAYGSNMDVEAMRTRAPSSRPLGVARLARHRFLIMPEGYASVARDPRATVWGLLWDLALADVPALDRYESLHTGLYTKIVQPVLTGGGTRQALVYVGHTTRTGAPKPGYMEGVLAAARAAGLPEAALADLALWLPRQGQSTRMAPDAPAPQPAAPRRAAHRGEPAGAGAGEAGRVVLAPVSSERVHFTVRGRVQGVGFRAWTAHQAQLRGLTGWVRNRRDGTVEAVVAGPAQAVGLMLAACSQGPAGSRVDTLEIHARHEGPPPPDEAWGFAIRDTV